MKLRRTCKEVTRLVLQSQDRPLGGIELLALRFHWLACDGCRQFRRQHQFMRQAFERWRGYRNGDGDE